jgi:hypothetical protein
VSAAPVRTADRHRETDVARLRHDPDETGRYQSYTDPCLTFAAVVNQIFDISDRLLPQPERLQTEDGDATRFRAFEWDTTGSAGVLVNMSGWTSVEALAEFTYSGDHFAILRRRREWFEQFSESMTAWVPSGHRPTIQDAETRIRAFTLRRSFPAPDAGESAAADGKPEWLCPV